MVAGSWDLYIVILDRYHLTPDQVDRLPADFVDELLVFMDADAEYQRDQIKNLQNK